LSQGSASESGARLLNVPSVVNGSPGTRQPPSTVAS
jgi:hypothetical protein